jgi:hypothetical protein
VIPTSRHPDRVPPLFGLDTVGRSHPRQRVLFHTAKA